MSEENEVAVGDGVQKCHCGQRPAGLLEGIRPKERLEENIVVMTIHAVDRCLFQEVDVDWWTAFVTMFYGPAQQEREKMGQMLACVIDRVGGEVRFDVKEAKKRAAEYGYKIEENYSQDGFVSLKTKGGGRVTLASNLLDGSGKPVDLRRAR